MRRCHSAGASAAQRMCASRCRGGSSASNDDVPLAVPSSPTLSLSTVSSGQVTSGSVFALEGDDVSDRGVFSARGGAVSPVSSSSSVVIRRRRLVATNWLSIIGHRYRARGPAGPSSSSSFEDSDAIVVRGEGRVVRPSTVISKRAGAPVEPIQLAASLLPLLSRKMCMLK